MGVDIWLLCIPLIFSVFSGLPSAQHNVRILREEGYDRKKFRMLLKEDKEYASKKRDFFITAKASMFGVFIFSGVILAALSMQFHVLSDMAVIWTALGVLTATYVAIGFISYDRLVKKPNEPYKMDARTVRLNAVLFLVCALVDILVVLLCVVIYYGIYGLIPSKAHDTANWIVPVGVSLISIIFGIDLPTDSWLLSIAASLVQPIESVLEKRKKIA